MKILFHNTVILSKFKIKKIKILSIYFVPTKHQEYCKSPLVVKPSVNVAPVSNSQRLT